MEYYTYILKNSGKWMEVAKKILNETTQSRRTNMSCTHLKLDISCKENDSHAIIHRPREPKKQGGPKRGHKDLPGKGNRIDFLGGLRWEQEGIRCGG